MIIFLKFCFNILLFIYISFLDHCLIIIHLFQLLLLFYPITFKKKIREINFKNKLL